MVALRQPFNQVLSLILVLYSLLFHLLLPFILLRLVWRSVKEPHYRCWLRERFGRVSSASQKPTIWVHAVSAGETNAAAPLITRLLEQYPDHLVWVTNMTPTGRARVTALFGENSRVQSSWLPYDLNWCFVAFLRKVNPSLLILIDTELWPNMLRAVAAERIPAVLVNGRLSARSARGYSKLGGLSRNMISSLTSIMVQTEPQRQRFLELGAQTNRVLVTGSIKTDQLLPADLNSKIQELRPGFAKHQVLIAASTHEGEEALLLDALLSLKETVGNLLLLLVPRHPARFDAVAELCRERNLRLCRHSESPQPNQDVDVFLLDTMGELIYYYGVADIAFVGGSLVPVGGHNFLEAASQQLPLIMGPHLHNLDALPDDFIQAGAMVVVNSAAELQETAKAILQQPEEAKAMGVKALALYVEKQGSLDRVMYQIAECLK